MIGDVAARSTLKAVGLLNHHMIDPQRQQVVVRDAQAIISPGPTSRFLATLTPEAGGELWRFFHSGQFDHLAMLVVLWRVASGDDELRGAAREQVAWNLRHEVHLSPEQLAVATELVLDVLTQAAILVVHAMGGVESVRAACFPDR